MKAKINETTQADLTSIHPSPFNRRREWGDINELAASIKTDGILEPLLVRARPGVGKGFELIAGERRFQAAKIAGLKAVPVILRVATDGEAIRISAVENLQRENPHPLDEADSYLDLQKDNKANTVTVIAALVGKSTVYIYRRLKLHKLCKKVRESFEHHEITVAHAERLACLTPDQQTTALEVACRHQRALFGSEFEPGPLGRLNDWIERNTKVDPASPDAPNYFPEFADAFEEPDSLLQLSASDMPGAQLQDKKHGLVGTRRWVLVKGKPCKHVRKGVIVHGGPLAILDVCISKECGKHHPKVTRGGGSGGGTTKIDHKAEQAHQEATWKYERDLRHWQVDCYLAIGKAFRVEALKEVPTDEAPGPGFGRHILAALLDRENFDLVAEHSGIKWKGEKDEVRLVAMLTDRQVTGSIMICLVVDALGYFSGYEDVADNLAGCIKLLKELGVAEPGNIVPATRKTFEAANPKPEKPSVKKEEKKGAKKGSK